MKKERGGRRWRWSAGRSGGATKMGSGGGCCGCSALVFAGLSLQLHLQSRFLSHVCSGSRTQHILDPELDGLEEVPGVEGPDMSWVAPFLYILRVLGGPESSSGVLTLSEKQRNRPSVAASPAVPARVFRKAGRQPLCPRRHTGPCHVFLVHHCAWRPGLRGLACAPLLETCPCLQSRARRHRSLLRRCPRGPPWPRALEASALLARRLVAPSPACAPTPPLESSLTPPRPPRFVWPCPCPWLPWCCPVCHARPSG